MAALVGVARRHRDADRGPQDHRLGRADPGCRRASSVPATARSRTSSSSVPTAGPAPIRPRPMPAASGREDDVSGQRSDTIMILRRDKSTGDGVAVVDPARPVGRRARSRQQAADQLGVQRRSRGAWCRRCSRALGHPDPPLRRDRLLRLQVARRCARRRADLRRLRHPRRQHRPRHHRAGLPRPRRRAGAGLRPQPALRGVPRGRRVARGPGQSTSAGPSVSSSSSTSRCRRRWTASRSIRSRPVG